MAGAVENHKEKYPAIKHGQLTLVSDWKKLSHWRCGVGNVKHEIGHSHFTAAYERANPRKKAEGDEKSTNKLNPAAGL